MKFAGNVDTGPRKRLYFGDVQNSEGTLTFDLPKINGQGALVIKQPVMLCNLTLPLPKNTTGVRHNM